MSLHLNSPTPISRVYLGDKLIGRMYYNGLIIYEFAESTLTQLWDNTGFLTPSWTLHPNYTAFVFMRGEIGARGGEWTPRQPSAGDLHNLLSARNQYGSTNFNSVFQTSNAPLTNVTTNWGILRATTQDRVFTLVTTPGGAGSPSAHLDSLVTRWLGAWRFGTGGRGGAGFSLMEGNVPIGRVHGSQGGPGKGIEFQYSSGPGDNPTRSWIYGGDPGAPGAPFPPVALPNDLSTTYPDFASTPFPATFLTSAPPMAAVTVILAYQPGIVS